MVLVNYCDVPDIDTHLVRIRIGLRQRQGSHTEHEPFLILIGANIPPHIYWV